MRSFLPPPVLDVLDNKKIEGAKRAAMLTAALKWLLGRVPMTLLPPQARPAMMLLKAFTPYLGYIGGFVAWSWGAVKTFDKGKFECYLARSPQSANRRSFRKRRDTDRHLALDRRSHTWHLGGQRFSPAGCS